MRKITLGVLNVVGFVGLLLAPIVLMALVAEDFNVASRALAEYILGM